MNQIRSRINALRRKMALEISVVRLRPLADDFCLQWDRARSQPAGTAPAPNPLTLSLSKGPPPVTAPSSAR